MWALPLLALVCALEFEAEERREGPIEIHSMGATCLMGQVARLF